MANQSQPLKMNLQLFAEGGTPEPTPAPEDSFNADLVTPESTPTEPEKAEPVKEETKPEPVKEEIPKLKIKFNHEEKEITLDEARELAQKGMNYEKAVAKAQQDARDAYIAEQGWVDFNVKPITTEKQYKDALKEQELREKYKELPKEVQDELIESKRDREERKDKEKEQQTEQAKQADQVAFLTWFKEQNGRDFDASKDNIPPEVWQDNANGIPLIAAYSKHENATLRERIKKLEQNAGVAQKAPVGSVTAHGSAEVAEEDPFLKGFNSVK